jgi:hypothetical protein
MDAGELKDQQDAAAQRALHEAQAVQVQAVRAAADANGLVKFRMVRGVVGHVAKLHWTDALQVIARGDAELA